MSPKEEMTGCAFSDFALEALSDLVDDYNARGVEIRRLRALVGDLKCLAKDIQDELQEYSDVVDGADGTPSPNWAMQLCTSIDVALGRMP